MGNLVIGECGVSKHKFHCKEMSELKVVCNYIASGTTLLLSVRNRTKSRPGNLFWQPRVVYLPQTVTLAKYKASNVIDENNDYWVVYI